MIVIGAGFTKAFYPSAPLLEDEYPIQALIEKYPNLGTAKEILETEIAASDAGKVNLERLITRLSSPMPYDRTSRSRAELEVIREEVEDMFTNKLVEARKQPGEYDDVLMKLMGKWLERRAHCVSFNYDDVADEKLWQISKVIGISDIDTGLAYWHPDGGYGFFCPPSRTLVMDTEIYMDIPSTLLLKLHGSLNWRVRRGASRPYRLADFVHLEPWLPQEDERIASIGQDILAAVPDHIEPRPFIVAPILAKTEISDEPVLQHVWTLARQKVRAADRVIFVGYSFPPTDLAARFLFSESIAASKRSGIHVVDLATSEDTRERLRRTYRSVFGRLTDDQFEWDGAVKWAQREIERD